MRVRFRVDGVLYETARVPKRMISGVVSRVKLMADMDIAEKRMPQDGRVSVNVDDRKIDLRVTTLPTQRGRGLRRSASSTRTRRCAPSTSSAWTGEPRSAFEAALHAARTARCS